MSSIGFVPKVARAASAPGATKSLKLKPGESKKISVKGARIQSKVYKSTKKSVATVTKKGKVTAKKTGSCQIRITVWYRKSVSTKKLTKKILKVKITVAGKSFADESGIYKKMIAMKEKYPEGKRWTNANSYQWKAIPGVIYTASGCAAFAAIISDAAFGKTTPANKITNPASSVVRVGDILRIDDDSHSVIVLEVHSDEFVIAEGNYNDSIHWGRTIPKDTAIDYLYTRY